MVAPNPKQIAVRIRALFDATVGKKKGKTLRLTRAQFNALAGRKKVEDESVFVPTVSACKRDGLHLLRVGSAYAVVEAVTMALKAGNKILLFGNGGSAADAQGSINSYSRGNDKTDFWFHADSLFGTSLADGEGLTGLFMPADDPQARGAQPMAYLAASGGFRAEGIPITPTDDALLTNPYPLMEVTAHSKQTGQQVGSLKVVVPVATETECRGCHVTGGIASTRGGTRRNPARRHRRGRAAARR